jgi:hypothetical protein
MNTRCGSERQFGGQGVNRRSLLASGAALTAGALMVPATPRGQPAERVRRVGSNQADSRMLLDAMRHQPPLAAARSRQTCQASASLSSRSAGLW